MDEKRRLEEEAAAIGAIKDLINDAGLRPIDIIGENDEYIFVNKDVLRSLVVAVYKGYEIHPRKLLSMLPKLYCMEEKSGQEIIKTLLR